jgi:hypothetical protein
MKDEIFDKGIRLFVEKAGAQISDASDVAYGLSFPGEPYPVMIDVGALGLSLGFSTYAGVLPHTSDAPNLLRHNWGSIEGTGFYFSVNVEENEPWLILETFQFIRPNATSEDIALILWHCWVQCRQAKKTFDST